MEEQLGFDFLHICDAILSYLEWSGCQELGDIMIGTDLGYYLDA